MVPIGLLWIRISDLVEAVRRQKVLMESGQGGWVTANAMGDASAAPGMSQTDAPLFPAQGQPGAPMGFGAPSADGIEAWFAVEPAGAIALRLNFGEYLYTFQVTNYRPAPQSRKMFASGLWTLLLVVSVVKAPCASARARCTR